MKSAADTSLQQGPVCMMILVAKSPGRSGEAENHYKRVGVSKIKV